VKDYNGFSGKQRDRAQRWLNKEWSTDRLARPSECVACGQTEGIIQAHAEDYSDPFRAGVTDGFHLCIICHAIVHARSKNQKAWRDYRAMIEAGGRAKVLKTNQNFFGAMARFVNRPIRDDMFDWGSPPHRRALLEIELSQDEVAKRLAHGTP
jgi:hypothetical protein